MQKVEKARECPCCGGEGVLCHVKMLWNPYYLKFKVECIKCHLGTANEDNPEEALEKWNARYEPPYGGTE